MLSVINFTSQQEKTHSLCDQLMPLSPLMILRTLGNFSDNKNKFCRFILASRAFKLVVDIAGDTAILHCLGKGPSPLPSPKKIQLKQLKSLGPQ